MPRVRRPAAFRPSAPSRSPLSRLPKRLPRHVPVGTLPLRLAPSHLPFFAVHAPCLSVVCYSLLWARMYFILASFDNLDIPAPICQKTYKVRGSPPRPSRPGGQTTLTRNTSSPPSASSLCPREPVRAPYYLSLARPALLARPPCSLSLRATRALPPVSLFRCPTVRFLPDNARSARHRSPPPASPAHPPKGFRSASVSLPVPVRVQTPPATVPIDHPLQPLLRRQSPPSNQSLHQSRPVAPTKPVSSTPPAFLSLTPNIICSIPSVSLQPYLPAPLSPYPPYLLSPFPLQTWGAVAISKGYPVCEELATPSNSLT